VIDNSNIYNKSKKWRGKDPPKRLLAIRLHAMGDVIITIPYLQYLRNLLPPGTRLDFLTIEECASIPTSINLFDKVFVIRGGRNFKKQLSFAIWLLPKLLLRRYDMILDLQDAMISRLLRTLLLPSAWTTFDRISPVPAGDRTQRTLEALGLGKISFSTQLSFKSELDPEFILKANEWDDKNQLVVLNPAGAFPTRNWPTENYIEFARLWLQSFPRTQFLILGVNSMAKKAVLFKDQLGDHLIDLSNKTTPGQAFAIIQRVKLVLTEDSGLMHMAWVSGIPTLALFGSTRSYHARPLGEKSFLFDSSDLPCGNCMLEACKYGDVHCLTRLSAEMVFKRAVKLVDEEVNSSIEPF
jgi:heptosyltransferase-2